MKKMLLSLSLLCSLIVSNMYGKPLHITNKTGEPIEVSFIGDCSHKWGKVEPSEDWHGGVRGNSCGQSCYDKIWVKSIKTGKESRFKPSARAQFAIGDENYCGNMDIYVLGSAENPNIYHYNGDSWSLYEE